MRPSVSEIKIGALYKSAVRLKLTKAAVEGLLVVRCHLSKKDAEALASHWFTTEALRNAS